MGLGSAAPPLPRFLNDRYLSRLLNLNVFLGSQYCWCCLLRSLEVDLEPAKDLVGGHLEAGVEAGVSLVGDLVAVVEEVRYHHRCFCRNSDQQCDRRVGLSLP